MFRKLSPLLLGLAASCLLSATTMQAQADSAGIITADTNRFSQTKGEDIYKNVCQACHMDKAQGAVGAGHYPALAKNGNLETPDYPVYIVLHGQKGMPSFGAMLDDEQVAAVVNYVRTHFGNEYKDMVKAEQVKEAR